MIILGIAILCTALVSGWAAWAGVARGDHPGYVAVDAISMLVQIIVASMLLSYGMAFGPVTIP